MKRLALLIMVFFVVSSISFAKGLRAYPFQLEDENGKIVKLEELKGNVVFLIFWATTCSACRKELLEISLLIEKYKDKPVKFFAIVIDEKDPEKIKKIKDEWGFYIPVLIGDSIVKSKYRIIGTPIIYILRKDLTIGKILYGSRSLEKLEKYINKFLEEKSHG
ncbi:MAG: TlpA family protein disulfide reductase [Aquificae bacterium]|nr:TlpA family protein disulfide reductase [Aquificota bacterium]